METNANRVCEHCQGVEFTDNKFKVITQMGRLVEVVFNYCPSCGRDLRPNGNAKGETL